MEKEKFLKLIKIRSRHITFGPKAPFGLTWAEYNKFTKLVDGLDFGCDIRKDVCASERKHDEKSKTCCCNGCARETGYLRRLPKNDKAISSVAKLFSSENGFWREGVGCILTKKYRSRICVSYRCKSARDNFHKSYLNSGILERPGARKALIMSFLDYVKLHQDQYHRPKISGMAKALVKGEGI